MTSIYGWLNLVKINDTSSGFGVFLCLTSCQAHVTASLHATSIMLYNIVKHGCAQRTEI